MLATASQKITLPSGASSRQAIVVDDNQEDFARRIAIERLQRDYGWTTATCRFLLERHKLREISSFAKASLEALRKGLWLYALDDTDLKLAAALPESERSSLRFAWYPKSKKQIYAIGQAFYAQFSPSEVALVQQSGMCPVSSSSSSLTRVGKTLYDMTVLTHLKTILSPAVKYSSHNLVTDDDDPNDSDWSPDDDDDFSSFAKRAARKRTSKKPMVAAWNKCKRDRSRECSPSPSIVIDLGSDAGSPTHECSPPRAESLPLTRSRKTKAEYSDSESHQQQQQLVLYDDSGRTNKKMRTQDFELQLQLHDSENERRLATVEHEYKLSGMQARMAQLELEKRMAILEVEKRASDEKSALLLNVNDKELALKQKEIDLLREKEIFLTDKCSFLASRSAPTDVPLAVAFGTPQQQPMTDNNNSNNNSSNNNPLLINHGRSMSMLQRVEAEPVPMRPVEPEPLSMDPERVAMHRQVLPYVNKQGRFNLSVTACDFYDLRDILLKVITTNQNGTPLSEEDESLLRSGLLNDYRIFLRNNNDSSALIGQREEQLFSLESQDNRVNCSNILLHYAFLKKAREFNGLAKPNKKTGQLETKHTIEVTDELRFSYGQDCCELWFPKLTHGVNTIVSESLRFFALSHKTGAGDGKICPFCCKNYINYSSGNIKNMHQLTGCDVLANLSQNERVVLEKILAQRAASNDFAMHKLVATYSEESLLRRATDEEIKAGHFVKCRHTGHKLRLNMPVFMLLRADTWEEFLQRLNAFSNSKTPLYNLNAQPFKNMLDALGIETPLRARAPAKLPSLIKNAPKRVVTPPKPRPGQMTEKQKEEAKQRERVSRCKNTFLGKVLLNHRGENYLANLPLRDFTIDEETGFGDGMYFETALEQEQRERRDFRLAQMAKKDERTKKAQPLPLLPLPVPFDFRNFAFTMPVFPQPQQQQQQQQLQQLLPLVPAFTGLQQQSALAPLVHTSPQRANGHLTNNNNNNNKDDMIIDDNEVWRLPTDGEIVPLDAQRQMSFDPSSEFNMFGQQSFDTSSSLFGTPNTYTDPFGQAYFQNGFGSQ